MIYDNDNGYLFFVPDHLLRDFIESWLSDKASFEKECEENLE